MIVLNFNEALLAQFLLCGQSVPKTRWGQWHGGVLLMSPFSPCISGCRFLSLSSHIVVVQCESVLFSWSTVVMLGRDSLGKVSLPRESLVPCQHQSDHHSASVARGLYLPLHSSL